MSGTNSSINNTLKLPLKGLVTSTNSAITSTDRVIDAFGKLQAQITSVNTGTGKLSATQTWSGVNTFSAATIGTNFTTNVRSNTINIGMVANNDNYSFVGISGYWGIRTDNSNGFNIDVYNTASPKNAFTINQSGNVGIGTNTPTHTITLPSTSTGWTHYNTSDQTTNFERVRGFWSGNVYNIASEKGGTGIVRDIQLTGKIGVNITPSSNTLDINTAAIPNGGIRLLHSAGTPFATLRIKNAGVSNSTQFGTISNNDLEFLTNSNIVGATFSTGNWFLGDSPVDSGFKLDVKGTARVRATSHIEVPTTTTGLRVSHGSQESYFPFSDNKFYLRGTTIISDQVGNGIIVGSATEFPSSIATFSSTTKGFLPPRQTQAQRTAISSPAVGLMVYQTDATEGLYVFSSSGWKLLNWT